MRIALEIGINWGDKRGVDTYFRGLLHGLSQIDAVNRYEAFTFFFRDYRQRLRAFDIPSRPNFRPAIKRWPQGLVERLEWSLGLPVIDALYVRPGRFDLYHNLCDRLPHLGRAKTVVTIHDLAPEVAYREALKAGRDPGRAPDPFIADAARRADRVIATTEAAREDLKSLHRIPDEKITVVHYGVDLEVYRPERDAGELEAARRRLGLGGPFILFMGPLDWRRHHDTCLEAVALLRREGIGKGLKLVFGGGRTEYFKTIEAKARDLGLAADMVSLGFVPQEDLPRLYALAATLVHPVTHAFGLSALEAMACGTPVVTSNAFNSGIPETVGDGALLVDPLDPADIARGLRDVLGSESVRRGLRERGLARARRLSWKRAAEQTLQVYKKAVAA